MAKNNVNLQIDSKAVERFLNGTEIQKASMKKAQMGLAVAKATAPRGSTGKFASGFTVKPAKVQGGRQNKERSGAVIYNSAPYAAYVHKKREENFMKNLRKRMDGKS